MTRLRTYWIIQLVFLFLVCTVFAESTNQPPGSVWDFTVQAAAAVGYRNNVLRSSIAPENSCFFLSLVDASLLPPLDSEILFILYMFYENIQYSDAPSVGSEQMFSGTLKYILPSGDHNEVGLEADYLYQHQIIDASLERTELRRVLVKAHSATLNPYFKRMLGGGWEAQLEGAVFRQCYESDLYSYWEGEAEASLVQRCENGSSLSVWYTWRKRPYDTRERVDRNGFVEPFTELVYCQNEFGNELRIDWDEDKQWQTTTRWSYLLNEDNGIGYHDYKRIYFRQRIRWTQGKWMIKGTVRFGRYLYPNQRIGNEQRNRSYVTLDLGVERRVGNYWVLFFNQEYEWNKSNDPLNDYRTWMASGGASYEF